MSVITDLIDENSSCHARIAELEARIVWLECEAQVNAAPVSEAKAQEPDCDRSACGDFSPGPCDNPDCSARRDRMVGAPAAKAQGVALDGSQLAGLLEQVRLDDDEAKPHGSGATYWNNAVIACQVAIRDALATPVQQVSVPDVSAMARILADRNADACNVNREDNWAIYGQDYIDDVTAMLAAAPAAPAADAGMVAVEWAKDAEEWGPALNEAGWLFLSELNEDPQKSALIFNNTKGPLRAAIMKYAEIVTAPAAPAADAGYVFYGMDGDHP